MHTLITKLVKGKKNLFLIVIGVAYLLTQAMVFVPQAQAISNPPTRKEIQQAGTFKQFLINCNSLGMHAFIKADDYADSKYIPFTNADDNSPLNVSTSIDAAVMGGNDERITCKELFLPMVKAVYGSKDAYINAFYDTSKVITSSGDRGYPAKECMKSGEFVGCGNGDFRNLFKQLSTKVTSWADSVLNGSNTTYTTTYKKVEAVETFKKCWKYDSSKDPANAKTPTADTKYKKDYYNPIHDSKSVGYIGEVYIEGAYKDGKVDCDTVFTKVVNAKLLDFDEDSVQEETSKQTKLDEVRKQLLGDPEAMKECVKDTPLANLAVGTVVNQLVEFMVSGGSISYLVGATQTKQVPADMANSIKSCLLKAYTDLQTTLDAVPADYNDADADKDPVKGDCDDILPSGWGILSPSAWTRNTLDWVGCTVIKGVLGFADTLYQSIDGFLSTDSTIFDNDAVKDSWNRFLTVANILFVIGFLLMIISTALGFGFVDAYTVKKFLPRIILAIILANLSFVIVQVAVEVTNAIGGAVEAFILGPVNTSDLFSQVANSSASGVVGAAAMVALGYVVVGLATGGIFAILPIALMVLFAILTAWVVITIRQVIILLLIVLAPLGIAMWAIPGMEAWAKRWWKLFIEMLMIYPIIKALMAAGVFTASLVYDQSQAQTGETNTFQALTVLGAIILPFFMLPAVFKIASSTLANVTGMVNNRGKGLIDRSKKLSSEKKKLGYQRKYAPRVLARRADMVGRMQSSASKGYAGSGLVRFGARSLGGHNMEAAMSARNAQESKIIRDQIDTGRDDEVRGLSVNKKAADREALKAAPSAADGHTYSENNLWRQNKNGKKEYQTLGGAWVDESSVIEGQKRWGNNQFAQQASLSYEMRKAMEDGHVEGVSERYASLATEQWGNSERQASGTWIGAGFENQGQHIEFKNTDWKTGELNGNKFAREIYEKKGSYPLSQMSGHQITQLGNVFDDAQVEYARAEMTHREQQASLSTAQASGDQTGVATAQANIAKAQNDMSTHQETMEMVSSISETFVQRGAAGQSAGSDDPAINQARMAAGALPDASAEDRAYAQTYGSGAAAVNEKINWLAQKTDRRTRQNPPTATTDPSHGSKPPGPNAEQNKIP